MSFAHTELEKPSPKAEAEVQAIIWVIRGWIRHAYYLKEKSHYTTLLLPSLVLPCYYCSIICFLILAMFDSCLVFHLVPDWPDFGFDLGPWLSLQTQLPQGQDRPPLIQLNSIYGSWLNAGESLVSLHLAQRTKWWEILKGLLTDSTWEWGCHFRQQPYIYISFVLKAKWRFCSGYSVRLEMGRPVFKYSLNL